MSAVAITLDVEGDYNTPSLRGVDEALPRLLEGFAAREVPLTLFVTGDVARARPAVVRALADAGHAVASHTMTHPRLSRCDADALRAELRDSRALLEDVTGAACAGFRAPFFDLPAEAGEALAEAGYAWSSSKAPFSPVAGYRHLAATGAPHRLDGTAVVEHPVPRMLGLPIPEGLSYRRLFWPASALARAIPSTFYLHPYELLDAVEPAGMPGWMRPFLTARQGARAGEILWGLVDAWRAAGARFVRVGEA
ncbi:MAG: polysaccharide deacetylase family protein [Polyangiales bacterium]